MNKDAEKFIAHLSSQDFMDESGLMRGEIADAIRHAMEWAYRDAIKCCESAETPDYYDMTHKYINAIENRLK